MFHMLYCNIRISCCDLEIEKARHYRSKRPSEQSICQMCKHEPKTEKTLFCHVQHIQTYESNYSWTH